MPVPVSVRSWLVVIGFVTVPLRVRPAVPGILFAIVVFDAPLTKFIAPAMVMGFAPPNEDVAFVANCTALLIVSPPLFAAMIPPLLRLKRPKPIWLAGPVPVVGVVMPSQPPETVVVPV